MITAMALGLDDEGPALRRNLCSEAGSANASTHDDDVEIAHWSGWLRIGKPCRLVVSVMFNAAFTDLLLLALAAILVVAAIIDVRTFTISNRLNATVALGAPLYWLSIAMAPWPGMAIQLAAGGIG